MSSAVSLMVAVCRFYLFSQVLRGAKMPLSEQQVDIESRREGRERCSLWYDNRGGC